MGKNENDKSFAKPFQEESSEIINDYATEEKSQPVPAKKPSKPSLPQISEPKKIIAGLTLDERIRYVWLEEKTLDDLGLKMCKGFFRKSSYHFFKDSKNTIYFFEKHEVKEEYKLFFTVSL